MIRWIPLSLSLFLLTGCFYQSVPTYRPVAPKPKKVTKPTPPPPPPKAKHTLKEVEDTNFSPEYMYPQTPSKSHVTHPASDTDAVRPTMSKSACIEMIGQEKFDHYSRILGGEEGALRRCALLKAMK